MAQLDCSLFMLEQFLIVGSEYMLCVLPVTPETFQLTCFLLVCIIKSISDCSIRVISGKTIV